MIDAKGIDWTDPKAKISRYFTVKEALYLHRWGRLANEGDGLTCHAKEQICILAAKMDLVRDFIGLPIRVHRWWSSVLYNEEVGGAKGSKHLCLGPWSAIDWDAVVDGTYGDIEESCRILRAALLPKLAEWGLRMENREGPWVHTDNAPVLYSRFFRP